MNIIIFFITCLYLLIQALEDEASCHVYSFLNNITLFIYSIWFIILRYVSNDWSILLTSGIYNSYIIFLTYIVLIVLCCKLKFYGTGDMKGIIVVFLSYGGDIFKLLIMLLMSNLIFVIRYKIMERKKYKERYPYFLSLFIGYILVSPITINI